MSNGTSVRGPNGAILIIGATAIAGIAGYVVTWLVYRTAGPISYAAFAVFWSAQFLVVGTLSGVQQEITRATRLIEKGARSVATKARRFGLLAGLLVALVIVGTAPLWQHQVFPDEGWALVLPLAVGAGSYALVATLCGSLYGAAQWRSLALMLVVDGLLRLAIIFVALLAGLGIVALAWAVALPFGLAIVLLWPAMRAGLVGRTDLDVGYRALSWNVARTVGASLSTAVLVSGFPLLLGISAGDVSATVLGELIFTITLARAPLIVTVMSLQSLLLVRFRDHASSASRMLLLLVGAIMGTAVILSVLAWWIGPPVLEWVTGHPTHIDGSLIGVIVLSSGVVACLSVSGAAVLAVGKHVVYLLGWAVAAAVTIAVMALPIDFLTRVAVVLLAAPAIGLALHAAWLLNRSIRRAG